MKEWNYSTAQKLERAGGFCSDMQTSALKIEKTTNKVENPCHTGLLGRVDPNPVGTKERTKVDLFSK